MIYSIRVKTVSEGLACLRGYLKKRESEGERTLVFAEDRLTLLAEQAICKELGGSFLSDVVTFARYLNQKSDNVLSKQASVMKIGELMLSHKEELSCFNKEYSALLSAKIVYETIAQFAACRITPKALREFTIDDRGLTNKISDIALLYEEYLSFLDSEGFADENTLLSLLPSALNGDESLINKNVVFFAFGSFTHQALEGVRACMERAKNVTGIFLSGEEDFYTREAEERFLSLASDYDFKRYEYPTAFSPLKKKVLSTLYSPEAFRVKENGQRVEGIHIYECESKSKEALTAVSLVKKAVLQGKRYRDICLFVPDVNAYYGELKRQFDAYKIPCFADVKKPLSAHPVSKFLLALFSVVDERCSPSSVSDVLSSVFFGDNGNFLNYLDKFVPVRGGVLKKIKDEDILEKFGFDKDELVVAQNRFLELYQLFKSTDTGVGYANAIRKALLRIDADTVLQTLADEEEDVAMKNYLSRIDPAIDKMLAEITAIAGNRKFTAGEFYDILSDGFSAAEISLIPIKSDAVFIGDISSSKVDDSQIVIAMGLTQNVPLYSSDVALISDKDIKRLKEKNIDVAPLISEVNLRSREGVVLNLLSFSQELYLLYPVTDGGEEVGKSELFPYFIKGLSLCVERDIDLFPYDCAERIPAEKRLFLEEEALRKDAKRSTEKYSALHSLLDGNRVLQNKSKQNKQSISVGKQLFFTQSGLVSPTLLEGFNTCPYKNYVQRGLQLKEREEGLISLKDSGNFIHAVLQRVGEELRDGTITDLNSCYARAEEVGNELMQSPEYSSLKDDASDRYFAYRMIADGKNIAGEVFKQLTDNYRVTQTEKRCFDKDLSLHGTIDRIDENETSFRIIDYKTGSIKTDLKYYYAGVKLQLELYAETAMRSLSHKAPAGVFYFPAKVDFSTVGEDESAYALQGYVSSDPEVLKGMEGVLAKKKNKVSPDDFPLFLRYAKDMAAHSKQMMEAGYIKPSPCDGTCSYCKYKGMCFFDGEERSLKFTNLSTEKIADLYRKKEEEDV